MRKLRIAQISTPFIAVPPQGYGGIELVVYNITEGLVRRGHEVTLFAPGDSKTSANLVSTFTKALDQEEMKELFSDLAKKLFWMHSLPSLLHIAKPFEMSKNFDIMHNHFHYIGLFFSRLISIPTIHTYHGDFSGALKSPIERMILEEYKDSSWTAISDSQKKNCAINMNFKSTIHHGIPVDAFEYNESPQDYIGWLGRITQKKGVEESITVAERLQKKLILAGIVNPRDQQFFSEKIHPKIDNNLIFRLPSLDFDQKVKHLKNSKVFLYPITWDEPFGLVMVEALATGTPIVAYGRGAVLEIVQDGITGYVINPSESEKSGNWIIKKSGIDGVLEAVERIYSMSELEYVQMRKNCRKRAKENFDIEKMIDKYESVYEEILS